MNEPERLSDHGSDLELSLLRSGRADTPPPASRRRTLIALGLAGSAAATTTAASATAVGAGASAGTAIAVSSGTVAMVKWILGGVLAGILTVSTFAIVEQRSEKARVESAPIAAPRPEATAAQIAPLPPRALAPPPVDPAPPTPTTAPPPPRAASLSDEIAALDAANKALATGDAAGALRAADDHDRRFPGGVLGPEATVVRIEALALRGDREAATRMARAFLDAHPASPHAKHLRSLLGLTPPDAPSP
jgi:hypothetical protein